MPEVYILFFKGHGFIPVLIRLFSKHRGQKFSKVPAHCAVFIKSGNGFVEYEAVSTGIRKLWLPILPKYQKFLMIPVKDLSPVVNWLDTQVGKPYGYLTVAITGLGIVSPSVVDRVLSWCWRNLFGGKSGRSCPKDCSLLAHLALMEGGVEVPGRKDGLPVSPNDLLTSLKNIPGNIEVCPD
jgi:hypothetical protein